VAFSAQATLNEARSEIFAKKFLIFPAGFGCSLQLAKHKARFHGGKTGERLAGLHGFASLCGLME
jgi:hypothetical protein